MTIQELAEEIHRAYQAAPPAERWQYAALAVLAKLNERPTVAAILDVDASGTIIEHVPPSEDRVAIANWALGYLNNQPADADEPDHG